MGAVIIFTAPLVHIEMAKTNPEVDAFEVQLEAKIAQIDNEIGDLDRQVSQNQITHQYAYNRLTKVLIPKKKRQLEENEEALEVFVDDHRLLSWKTPRALAVGMGPRLPWLIFTIIIHLFMVVGKPKQRLLRLSFGFFLLASYTISFYHYVWVFWPAQDIPLRAYRPLILFICALCALGTIFYVKYLAQRSNKVKKIIQLLNRVLVLDVIPHVKDDRKYKEEVMWPTLKKVSNDT